MKKKIFSILKYILIMCSVFISGYLIKIITDLDILPSKYYWLVIVILLLLNILAAICLLVKKLWTKIISIILYIIIFIISIIGINYGSHTIEFFNDGFDNEIEEVTKYDVIVLKSSKYNNIDDLEDKDIGYININSNKVLETIKSKVKCNTKEYNDMYTLYDDLVNEKIDSMVVDEVYLDILEEEYEDIDSNIRIIDTFEIDTNEIEENSNSNSNSNDNKDDSKSNTNDKESTSTKISKYKSDNGSINIYISGSDSRSGTIKSKSRSDVNMVMTINPNTKTILLTSIPRDYYVQLHGTSGYKDKLTHSGIYGVNMSKETVEDLLGIEIDYTIKVGFKSVVKIVDLVGGIDIYSNYSFTSHCGDGGAKRVKVKKGWNHFNGAEALSYARERYAYSAGDRQRIKNQQQVLEAVIKKISTNKSLLLKYEEFLNSFKTLYVTDIPNKEIKKYIKNQLNDMSSWTINNQSLDGTGSYGRTYSMPGRNLYIMIPSQSSVNSASNKIISVMKGN